MERKNRSLGKKACELLVLSHLVRGCWEATESKPQMSLSCSLQVKLLNSSSPGGFSQTV